MYLRQIQIAVRDQSAFDSFLSSELLIPDISPGNTIGPIPSKESIVKCADEIDIHITDTTHHGGGVSMRGISADMDEETGEIFVNKIFFSMISVDQIATCLGRDMMTTNGLAKDKFGFVVRLPLRSARNTAPMMASIKLPIFDNRLSIVLLHVTTLQIPAWLRFIRFGTNVFSEYQTVSQTADTAAEANGIDHPALDIFFSPAQIGMIGAAPPNFTIDIRYFGS